MSSFPGTRKARESAVEVLHRTSKARVVVAVYDDYVCAAWDEKLPPEDLRQELITAGNFVRNAMQKGETQ